MTRTGRTTSWMLMALAALLLGGCGGGDGGDGPPDPGVDPLTIFSGTYFVVAFQGSGASDTGVASWGTMTADGAGTVTGGELTTNANGVITASLPLGDWTYTIDSGRGLVISQAGTPLLEGRITMDGSVAGVSVTRPGFAPAVMILGRMDGTYDVTSLSGLYHFASLGYNPLGPSDLANWGTLTFDGMGSGNGSVYLNDDGTISGPSPLSVSYAVAADGTVSNFGALTGAIVADGELVLMSGGIDPADVPVIFLLVKGTTGASDALLSGGYGAVALEAPVNGTPQWLSTLTTGSADGAGRFAISGGTTNSDGTIGTGTATTLDYAVGADGFLDLESMDFAGGVSPSGRFAIAGGEANPGDNPQIIFLAK